MKASTPSMNWQHNYATINGIRLHWVEHGQGMPVLFCHGFPQTWFCWHRQISALAAAGYRVIALDMRGMGDSEVPTELEDYGCEPITKDLLGLLDHLGIEKTVISGVDFGAFAMHDFVQRHPERVIASITLENPAAPHNPETPPLTEYAEMAKKHFLHIEYFREPGPADAALNAAPYEFLTKVYYALSGNYHYLDVWKNPPGTTYLEALPDAPPMPWNWLEEWEMEAFVAAYARSGFTGGLNYYRAMDIKWRDRKPFEGVATDVPAYFIGSEQDPDLEGFHGDDPVALLRAMFPDLRRVEMVANAGHMIQLEQTDKVNSLLLEFLSEISASA